MAIINFPDTTGQPTDGSFTYTFEGVLYSWTGTYWAANTQSGFDSRYVEVAGDTMTGDLTVPSLNGGPLAGFRNQIINGNLAINQRNLDIGITPVGAYGPDRWKKLTTGMTQIIEEGNYEPNATYTMSGVNVTTQQLTAPASGNWTLPGVPTNARKIQLEPGPVATPFEHRPIATELALCQRYYEVLDLFSTFGVTSGSPILDSYTVTPSFAVKKRAKPTATRLDRSSYGSAGGYSDVGASTSTVYAGMSSLGGTTSFAAGGLYAFNAEL